MQKIITGLLAATIIGAVAVGVYDASQAPQLGETTALVSNPAQEKDVVDPVIENQGEPVQVSPTEVAAVTDDAPLESIPVIPAEVSGPVLQQQSVDNLGEPWNAGGVITALTEVGMTLKLDDGGEAFVELGPTTFWQDWSAALIPGQHVLVDGFNNDGQIHARTVSPKDGIEIAFRTDDGQPLWSGGANGSNGNGGGAGETQVAPEDWVTLTGVILANTVGNVTIQTTAGEQVQLQLGQPSFWQQQGITLAVGTEISALGYWQGESFQTGEVEILATGERIMLRDPNGRPLWAGPGNSNGNGGGGTNNGGGTGNTGSTAGNGGTGNSDSTGSNGNGRQYRGGR